MLQLIRKALLKPVMWASEKYASQPDRERIFTALTALYDCILEAEKKKGLLIPFNANKDRFIIFSDQHKGSRNGADDFMICEPAYTAALDYYFDKGYFLVSLGDSEELWENLVQSVKKHHKPSFDKEKKFAHAQRFLKIFGNHDLFWQNDPFAGLFLREIYECDVQIYEGAVLQTMVAGKPVNIFCTHGHQGDAVSDGNWFSKFFVSKVWAPLQAFLKINPNTPAYDAHLKTLHNSIMYEWSAAQKDLFLITGHTHQPVFESLTHIERLLRQLLFARQVSDTEMIASLEKEIQVRKFQHDTIAENYLQLKPTYFNSGCCCFSDGDITGIEIDEDCIRLIKWRSKTTVPERLVLEESSLEELNADMQKPRANA